MNLPETIERDYMRFRAVIMHDVSRIASPRIAGSHLLRTDAEDDPQLLELAAVLGLSAEALVDKRKLRAKLRRFAKRLSVEKQAQLSALLGRWVRAPDEHLVERWVSEQTTAINKSVDTWLGRAVQVGALAVTGNFILAGVNQTFAPQEAQTAVALTGAAAATRARQAASSAVLSLNTQLLGNVAVANGLSHYRWITQDDEVVRDNHFDLHYSLQSWAFPPAGGGTKPGEPGHPGDGYGCRCYADPVSPLQVTM